MSAQQDDRKPLPSVEMSQKYMAWNIKEMSESLKTIASVAKNVEKILSTVGLNKSAPTNAGRAVVVDELPF